MWLSVNDISEIRLIFNTYSCVMYVICIRLFYVIICIDVYWCISSHLYWCIGKVIIFVFVYIDSSQANTNNNVVWIMIDNFKANSST